MFQALMVQSVILILFHAGCNIANKSVSYSENNKQHNTVTGHIPQTKYTTLDIMVHAIILLKIT
jgi:hypothetical protein